MGVAGPNVIQQCLNAGLLDELTIELVPGLWERASASSTT
jgi:hypothetical protein